jgi:hypothetical protein
MSAIDWTALTTRHAVTAAVLWLLPWVYYAFLEGYMIAQGQHGVPFTTILRAIRFDLVGRYVLSGFMTWFYYHIILRPAGVGTGKQDFIWVAVGFAVASIYGKWYPLGGQ